jgi:Family of unknown function (DUF5681)
MKLTSRRRTMPVRDRASDRRRRQQRSSTRNPADTHTPEDDYRVGPGRPPKEHRFKPGQSGNPMGARRKTSDEDRVGPGRPPREFQFKPGQSGNPTGAKRKTSLAQDLKATLQRALNEKVRLQQGERERIITKAAAGLAKLVDQFAIGDRYARRDVMALAGKLGVDLAAGHGDAIEKAVATKLSADDQAFVDDYFRRRHAALNSKIDSDLGAKKANESQPESEENDHVSPISRSRD